MGRARYHKCGLVPAPLKTRKVRLPQTIDNSTDGLNLGVMTRSSDYGMFSLSEVHPGLSGRLIVECKAPIERGLAKLRKELANRQIAVFDHVTEFDYDGTWSAIETIRGFDEASEAAAYALARLDELVGARLQDGTWSISSTPAREVNVLPATHNVMPGKFPNQSGFAALRASEYETCYFRTYTIEATQSVSLVETLLGFSGLGEDLVDYLRHQGAAG